MPDDDDPVQMWQGLRGSHDFVLVVRVGQQLCETVETARRVWREQQSAIAELQAQVDAHDLAAGLAADDEQEAVASQVRGWHDLEHWPHGWEACPHWLCRWVATAHPDTRRPQVDGRWLVAS